MKTLKVISAGFFLIFFGVKTGNAQETDTTMVDTAQTVSIMVSPENDAGVSAQETWRVEQTYPSQSGFHIGIRYQPTFSALDFRTQDANAISADFRVSHGWAGSLNAYFNNYIGTHLEVMYSRLQHRYTERGIDRRADLDYIHIPLLLSLNTNYGRPVNFNIHFGPQLGLNVRASLDADVTDESVVVDDAVLQVRPTEISIGYGLGVDFGFGQNRNIHLNIGLRGNQGLIDIEDSDVQLREDQYMVLERSRLNFWSAYVGVMFKL